MARATVEAYASSGCVLLAFDWKDGALHADFLGFAIRRTPGHGKSGKPDFLFNKLDFVPLAKNAKPKGSDVAPIQKFNWWDGGLDPADIGKTFRYDVIPVLGSGPGDLVLRNQDKASISVKVPAPLQGRIATYFNRAVVSAQSFLDVRKKPLKAQMAWLANGLQNAVPEALGASRAFACAIYHLTDNLWILPAFRKFAGDGSIVYFAKGDDKKSQVAIDALASKKKIAATNRTAISKLMHDKFIVSRKGSADVAVLMGSTNFTPEAQTIQANLLHIVQSKQLAKLYRERADLLASNPKTAATAVGAGWKNVTDIAGSKVRVFFLPEPGSRRDFLDTVTNAVKAAKSSVLFCMFTASDKPLLTAIFDQGDSKDHLIYGLLNTVDDPDKPTKTGGKRNLPEIAATIFHRSRTKTDTLPYAAFGKDAPRGFLPELRTIDTSAFDVSTKPGAKSGGLPPIHVHHKFIVIDGETDAPTIYTGSPNFSKSSENSNDENVLEIRGNATLARVYVAEFMRLYNHYRARAIWNRTHTGKKPPAGTEADPLILKTTRNKWVNGAYTPGTKAFLARTRGL